MKDIWPGWRFTTDHPLSEGNTPVLLSPTGRAYKPENMEPQQYSNAELAKALGVTRGAIQDRIRRGTLPDYDGFTAAGRGYWYVETIKHLFK